MDSETTIYTRDGNWKVDIEAWTNNFFIYSSVGTQATVYRKVGSSVWGGSSWDQSPARTITIRNVFNGGLAFQDGRWDNASYAELKAWSVGFGVNFTAERPERIEFTIDSVEGIVEGWFGNGEPFSAHVAASNPISDNSIW